MDSKKKYEELVSEGEINNLPNWFNGDVYTKGGLVKNPFSGAEYYLNAQELSMYDFIKGAEFVMASGNFPESLSDDFSKALDWFSTNNIDAYMHLLD